MSSGKSDIQAPSAPKIPVQTIASPFSNRRNHTIQLDGLLRADARPTQTVSYNAKGKKRVTKGFTTTVSLDPSLQGIQQQLSQGLLKQSQALNADPPKPMADSNEVKTPITTSSMTPFSEKATEPEGRPLTDLANWALKTPPPAAPTRPN